MSEETYEQTVEEEQQQVPQERERARDSQDSGEERTDASGRVLNDWEVSPEDQVGAQTEDTEDE